jgi:hypothetical protein
MKVYVATLVDLENTVIVGVYTSEDVAMSKLDKSMDDLYDSNEDLGVFPMVVEKYIDDIEDKEFT